MSEAVFLDDLATRLSRRGAVLAPESALFIVLEAMESLGGRAMVLSPSSVTLSPEGAVRLGGPLDPAHDETAVLEGAVETLEAVLQPVPVSVVELSLKVRSSEIITRSALLSELSAMLVPLNRRAARRMVGRLVRECSRPAAPAVSSTTPADTSLGLADMAALSISDEAPAAHDTVLDGDVLGANTGATRTTLGGRLPDDWDDDSKHVRRRSTERRNAWLTMAVAVMALAAAVVFLVGRVKATGG